MSEVEERVRHELAQRRDQLARLVERRSESRLVELLRRVDGALAEVDLGIWGRCAVCHEAVHDIAQLESGDPLVSVCLECLTGEERQALERDLEAAARVQRALLPPPRLSHGGWEMAYLWQPRGAVSGDHVDLVRAGGEGDPLLLLFGDVAGKGVAASLLQSHLHGLFHALASPEAPLGELLARANRLFFAATAAASYATMALLRLHADGRVEIANAGHTRPLLADARGVRPIEGGGLPLGLFGEATYEARALPLGAGETLLLYTDGWTEAAVGEEEFGIGRAAAALRRAARLDPAELVAACRREMEEFLAGAPRGDDLTLLALRRAPA
jgi:sigma-B regulation protein RsbU (phosphoserine phosphatase)